ncbi:hypothetical protein SDC9_129614 [bioreactor metagenome]|uniref:Uncharacterized protein n=1 Tax=bioreactor metagenome TaxID=1076179 RepID=A0A645D0C4_9ZZZZ
MDFDINFGKSLFEMLMIVSSLCFSMSLFTGLMARYNNSAAAAMEIHPTGPSISESIDGISND